MLNAGQRLGDDDYFDMSFSGLKTALRRAVSDASDVTGALPPSASAALARAFQDALVETLVEKTVRAAVAHERTRIVVGGGVACNRALIGALSKRAGQIGATVFAPSPRLATDNAAMIARAALFRYESGDVATLALNAYAQRDLPALPHLPVAA
jgi:N6-L-threonylcarbamoyladenine synthase